MTKNSCAHGHVIAHCRTPDVRREGLYRGPGLLMEGRVGTMRVNQDVGVNGEGLSREGRTALARTRPESHARAFLDQCLQRRVFKPRGRLAAPEEVVRQIDRGLHLDAPYFRIWVIWWAKLFHPSHWRAGPRRRAWSWRMEWSRHPPAARQGRRGQYVRDCALRWPSCPGAAPAKPRGRLAAEGSPGRARRFHPRKWPSKRDFGPFFGLFPL